MDEASTGHPLQVVGVLLGAIAAEPGVSVWSRDADFGRLERLELASRQAGGVTVL